jgi:hypothetical protein
MSAPEQKITERWSVDYRLREPRKPRQDPDSGWRPHRKFRQEGVALDFLERLRADEAQQDRAHHWEYRVRYVKTTERVLKL